MQALEQEGYALLLNANVELEVDGGTMIQE